MSDSLEALDERIHDLERELQVATRFLISNKITNRSLVANCGIVNGELTEPDPTGCSAPDADNDSIGRRLDQEEIPGAATSRQDDSSTTTTAEPTSHNERKLQSSTCQNRESFVMLLFEDSVLVRSNLGGQGGRCDTDASLCTEGLTNMSRPHDIYLHNVGTADDGTTIDLSITNQSEYAMLKSNMGLPPCILCPLRAWAPSATIYAITCQVPRVENTLEWGQICLRGRFRRRESVGAT
mgnify:CR=1 FL=1